MPPPPLPIYCFFVNPPQKKSNFSGKPHNIKIFSPLNPSHFLKVTKALIKIYQFKFLVMTEKTIFVYKLFLSLNTADLIFYVKTTITPEKVHPLFPSNPL